MSYRLRLHDLHLRAGLLALSMLCWLLPTGCGGDLPEKPSVATVRNGITPPEAPPSKPTAGKRVLLVHSYHPEYPWVSSITDGVKAGLDGAGLHLEIFYMDTKRKTSEAWKVRAGELAQERMSEYAPDVIIAVDDNAQEYFGKRLAGGAVPLVFCGVNADPTKYGYPAANVTGIIERPHFRGTSDYVRMLTPVKRIAVLSSDDPTSVGALTFMKEEYADIEVTEWQLVHRFDEWKEAVLRFNDTVDAFGVYMYHTIEQEGGSGSIEPEVVMEWTRENATIPSLGFFDFGVEDGLLIGVVESGFEHGEKAARYAVELLRGTPITSLPVMKANVGQRMVNRETARRLGIELTDQVLEGARVEPTS